MNRIKDAHSPAYSGTIYASAGVKLVIPRGEMISGFNSPGCVSKRMTLPLGRTC